MQQKLFDVGIVGASVSGSLLALKLAASGVTVALADRRAFQYRKPCGEGLSARGVALLNEVGIDLCDGLYAPLSRYEISSGTGKLSIPVVGNGDPTDAFTGISGVRRDVLDKLFADRLLAFPEISRFNNCIENLTYDNSEYLLEGPDGTIRCRFVVLASGNNFGLVRSIGGSVSVPKRYRYGLTFHLAAKERITNDCVAIDLNPGFQIFCTPCGPHDLNLSVLGDKAAIKAISKHPAPVIKNFAAKFGSELEVLAMGLGSGPFGRFTEESSIGRCLFVGDCKETLDPIGGMGMTAGMIAASLAATAIVKAIGDDRLISESLSEYQIALKREADLMRGFTSAIAFMLSNTLSIGLVGKFAGNRSLSRIIRAAAAPVIAAPHCNDQSSAGPIMNISCAALRHLGAFNLQRTNIDLDSSSNRRIAFR